MESRGSVPIIYRARYLLPIAAAPIEDGALLVVAGRIAAVGRKADIAALATDAKTVDFGESLLLPPLVNAHTHLELTHFPQWAQAAGASPPQDDFIEWIRHVIRVKRQISTDFFAPSIAAGIKESLAAGTGAVGDILSFFPARTAHADSPLRGRIFLETLGQDPDTSGRVLRAIEEIIVGGRIGASVFGFAPHSLYTLSRQHLREVIAAAGRRHRPLTIHLAESPAETEFIATSSGAIAQELYPYIGWSDKTPPPSGLTPVEFLAENGGLHAGVLLAHGVQVSAADIERIAKAGAAVALCPRSNARLGVGRAPVELYRQAGVSLALGTDSRASCDSLSLWDELAFARTWFAGALGPAEWLSVATLGGARALAIDDEMGTLAVNAGAHFQVLTPAALPPLRELEEFLCAPGRSGEVEHLYLGGRKVAC
ncbi:MAG: amidohydrolase family protein [Desulfuromonadales bacterium]